MKDTATRAAIQALADHLNSPEFQAACSEIKQLQDSGADLDPNYIAERLGLPVELLMEYAALYAEAVTGQKFTVIKVPDQGRPN